MPLSFPWPPAAAVSGPARQVGEGGRLKYFGTAVDNPSLGNGAYTKIARDTDEFGQLTPANGQEVEQHGDAAGSFSFGSGDAVANVAKQTRQLLRCHTLVWYNQLPSWGAPCQPPSIASPHTG